MKNRILLILAFSMVALHGAAQGYKNSGKIHVVPQPVSLSLQKGEFILNSGTTIVAADDRSFELATLLCHLIDRSVDIDAKAIKLANPARENSIVLKLLKTNDTSLRQEGYRLKISDHQITLAANRPNGLFYGIQTLMQLLPRVERQGPEKINSCRIPCLAIVDYPRFGYRGMMLDVSRHFFSKKMIEKFIDEMAKYKFNVFHWHLTDDQGWRLEIKGLPELTKAGAWRVPRTGKWGTFSGPMPGEKATYGGYYTQEDVKEIVRYAKDRFIDVLPEIDVPAHSLALIASYPNLSCTGVRYNVWPQGVPDSIDNVLCVASDSTWLILDKIFTQVAQLFPYQYIHTGGDEANRNFWMNDPKDIALMKREGIQTPAGLQSYFEKRLEKLIMSKGKKMIGWDEIVEGGLAPESVVMSWRGMKGGIAAAKMGHSVIMTPILQTYLSRKQGDPAVEPFGPGLLPISACYDFEPVPDGINPALILGGQASIWTERIPNFRHLEYMTWPRAMAISEVLWSPKSVRLEKNAWQGFAQRVKEQFQYLDADSVKYSRSMYDPVITATNGDNDSIKVELGTEMPGLTIHYSFDGTDPDQFYPVYTGKPLSIPEGASEIRAISYHNGKPVSRQVNKRLIDLDKKTKK